MHACINLRYRYTIYINKLSHTCIDRCACVCMHVYIDKDRYRLNHVVMQDVYARWDPSNLE